MKKFTFLFLFLSFNLFSQKIDSIKVTFPQIKSVVINTNDLTAIQIYTRAKDYINKTFEDPDAVIKVDDINKSIRYNGISRFSYHGMIKNAYNYSYTMLLEFKENKYRITFSNIYLLGATVQTNLVEYPFKNNGTPRKNKEYVAVKKALEGDLNNIHFLLYNYIILHEQLNDW